MSTAIGQEAEAKAAEWLEGRGYQILDKNWRTKWCEIDLIAKKDNQIFFVEVKYRRQANSGSGLSYITPKKLRQMAFAAEIWLNQYDSQEDYELSAIELSGIPPKVSAFLPELT